MLLQQSHSVLHFNPEILEKFDIGEVSSEVYCDNELQKIEFFGKHKLTNVEGTFGVNAKKEVFYYKPSKNGIPKKYIFDMTKGISFGQETEKKYSLYPNLLNSLADRVYKETQKTEFIKEFDNKVFKYIAEDDFLFKSYTSRNKKTEFFFKFYDLEKINCLCDELGIKTPLPKNIEQNFIEEKHNWYYNHSKEFLGDFFLGSIISFNLPKIDAMKLYKSFS